MSVLAPLLLLPAPVTTVAPTSFEPAHHVCVCLSVFPICGCPKDSIHILVPLLAFITEA